MLIAKLTQQATGSLDNINPAIATLKELGPNVLTYWTSFDQAFNLLNSGETWISVTSTDRTIDQALKGAPVKSYFPEEGTTFVSNTVGIAKGSTHGKLAEVWINFLLEKEQQGRIASNLASPVRSDVAIDPKVAELLPSGKARKLAVAELG